MIYSCGLTIFMYSIGFLIIGIGLGMTISEVKNGRNNRE